MKPAVADGLAVLAVGILTFVVGGLLLPTVYRSQASQEIAASPAAIHAWVGDPSRWPQWSSLADEAVVVTTSDALTGVAYTAVHEGQPGDCTVRYLEVAGGTRVLWTCEGTIGRSPLRQWLGLRLPRRMSAAQQSSLERLKETVESG